MMGAVTGSGSETGSARERLLAAAGRLFYAHGIAATGIDAITAEAGVAKMSLYNNFASKDALVLAYIEARHEEWLELYRARRSDAPEEQALAVFDAYADHAGAAYEHGFRGCGLLNAAAELPAGSAARDTVRRHKEEVEAILRSALDRLGRAHQTDQLVYLLEGAMARAGLEGDPARLSQARAIAAELLGTR